MAENQEQPISVEHAAQLIYRTPHPDPKQVGSVRALLLRGELRTCAKHRLTTTRGAVAEYLAGESLRRQHQNRAAADEASARHGAVPRGKPTTPAEKPDASQLYVRRVYREALGDYFRSVLFIRSTRNHSTTFQRTVLGLQASILALCLVVMGWTGYSLIASASSLSQPAWYTAGAERVRQDDSAEKRTAEAWLKANRNSAELLDLLPAHRRPGGKSIRVRYRYLGREEQIAMADEVFVIRGREVLRIEQPDADDKQLDPDSP